MEIEAKYRATRRIRPREIERVRLEPFALGARERHDLFDTLLDTPERALGAQLRTCRIRRDGARSYATIKGPRQLDGTLHRREEIEWLLESDPFDRERWPASLNRELETLAGRHPLTPLFHVRNRRTTWPVTLDGVEVAEIALDRGWLEAGGTRERFHEIEIEAKGDGQPDHLRALAHLLTGALPLVPEPRGKAERGFALLARLPAPPYPDLEHAAAATTVRPDAPLAAAGRSRLAGLLVTLYATLPRALDPTDTEGVHDARVALRRMRTILRLLERRALDPALTERYRRWLGRLARRLGRARDAEVLLATIDAFAATLEPDEAAGLDRFRRRVERQRERALDRFARELDRPRTERRLLELEHWLRTPGSGVVATPRIRDRAGGLIWRRFERVSWIEPALGSAIPEQLHALRLDVKRLRYTLEFFRDALGEGSDPLHAELQRVQDHLGELQDAAVALERIDSELARGGATPALLALRADRVAALAERLAGTPAAVAPLLVPEYRHALARLLADL